jgi:hypothetical protein
MPPLASTLDAITCFSSVNCGRPWRQSWLECGDDFVEARVATQRSPFRLVKSGDWNRPVGIDPGVSACSVPKRSITFF